MQQQHRDAYLKAMGIEVWHQRVAMPVVPGAGAAAPGTEAAAAAPEAMDAPARFTLGRGTAAPDLCVLFDLPVGVEAVDAQATALVRDLLAALGGEPRSVRLDVHSWSGSAGAPEEQPGEESVAAAVARVQEIAPTGKERLVLLGERAAALLPAAAHPGRRVCASRGVAEMVANPARKREVWADLQPLLEEGRRDG